VGWLFSATSGGFGYGYEAVRIRVKKKHIFLIGKQYFQEFNCRTRAAKGKRRL
jgi:hypothetical protein